MSVYIFEYKEEYTGKLYRPIYRPVVWIHLQGKDKKWHSREVYVDSGADRSLLPKGDCDLLGYTLEDGDEILVGRAFGKGPIKAYIHKVSLRIKEVEFKARIAFAERNDIPRFLGRIDVFEHFRICFIERARWTCFHFKEGRRI